VSWNNGERCEASLTFLLILTGGGERVSEGEPKAACKLQDATRANIESQIGAPPTFIRGSQTLLAGLRLRPQARTGRSHTNERSVVAP